MTDELLSTNLLLISHSKLYVDLTPLGCHGSPHRRLSFRSSAGGPSKRVRGLCLRG